MTRNHFHLHIFRSLVPSLLYVRLVSCANLIQPDGKYDCVTGEMHLFSTSLKAQSRSLSSHGNVFAAEISYERAGGGKRRIRKARRHYPQWRRSCVLIGGEGQKGRAGFGKAFSGAVIVFHRDHLLIFLQGLTALLRYYMPLYRVVILTGFIIVGRNI